VVEREVRGVVAEALGVTVHEVLLVQGLPCHSHHQIVAEGALCIRVASEEPIVSTLT